MPQQSGFALWSKERLQELGRRTSPTPKPSTVRVMTEPERAWVGAFIEADGCAFVRTYPDRRRPHITISVTQKEVEPISALLRATGVGNVRFRLLEKSFIYIWEITRREDALILARQCAPYSVKLQEAIDAHASVLL